MAPVSIPRFASSSTAAGQTETSTPAWGNLAQEGAADPLDFDLLAEYLLDDNTSSQAEYGTVLPDFDFTVDSAPVSGVVSPDQTEDGTGAFPRATPAAPAPAAPAPAPAAPAVDVSTAPAPAPFALPHPPNPILRQEPVSVPAPAPTLYMPQTNQAPAVTVAPLSSAPTIVSYQHAPNAGAPVPSNTNKRRRVDIPPAPAPAPVVAPLTKTQFTTNGVVPAPTPHMVAQAMAANGGTTVVSGRKKTQAQIDRRRERNRILARRTRLRKKFFFESLQKEVIDLQRENVALKEIARTKLDPQVSKTLLDDCKAVEKLPSELAEACGETGELAKQDFSLIKSIQTSQQCFVITDPSLQDNPIVYASNDFLSLTGYAREEVLGRNCRFLQGTETSASKIEQVRKAIANGEDVTVTMINYTADGTAFWNKLFIAALRDAQNNIVNFIGVIVKVVAPEPGDPEVGKRLPGEAAPASTGPSTAVAVAAAAAAGEKDMMDVAAAAAAAGVGATDGSGSSAADLAAIAAEGTVMAIEGAVRAAVAAAPAVSSNL
eukprot:CAMPEP_0195284276 /NCGR_PEP_ID=MMETSP0707-20130614/2531_1 /TAXON_ID=33640 /ORGANISM="Asterionellopsis glacialis, Strain CCMP134" /LENGTH=544 /DNA_ID=CAMNT_0040343597 /DNA_START=34 /DNA_END=1668 /DNA_ORIENTATION=+